MTDKESQPSSSHNVILGLSTFVGFVALCLAIVALVLYATVPQPVTPTLKHVSIDAVDNNTATSTVTFTPANYTYYSVTTSTIKNRVIVGLSVKKNFFYAIYNKSTTDLDVYNKDGTTKIETIASKKAVLFLVNNSGVSVSMSGTVVFT